jgi:hypothetical protein
LVAFTLMALIGQVAQRRLNSDDGITGGEAADFVVALVIKGLRPNWGRSRHEFITAGQRASRRPTISSAWRIDLRGMFVHHRRSKHLVR